MDIFPITVLKLTIFLQIKQIVDKYINLLSKFDLQIDSLTSRNISSNLSHISN